MKFFGILFFLTSVSFSFAMDDFADFYDETAGIVSIPYDKFRQYAADLSEALSERDANVDYDNATFDPREWQRLVDYESTKVKVDEATEEERRHALLENKKIFMAGERDIWESANNFLRDRKHDDMLGRYQNMVCNEKNWPSRAAFDIAQCMLEIPSLESDACELLEFIRNKINLYPDPSCNWMEVERDICYALTYFFRDKFNNLVKTTHPAEPTAPLYTALRKCVQYLATNPDGSWDDIECAWSYIYEFSQRHLKKMAFWYLDKSGIPHQLLNIEQSLLNQAQLFFETTSYGLYGGRYDLWHLLRENKFKCIVDSTTDKEQHIWIKYPYQVRITKKGKVTVALMKDDPLKHQRQHGSLKINEIIKRKGSHELLKISTEGQVIAFVPAFVKEEKFQAMWNRENAQNKRKILMDRAHHKIDSAYMDFDRVTRFLRPPTNERSVKFSRKNH